MSTWTGLDFFIFLIFLVNVLLGMARGGMREIISMLSLCAALVITIKFTIPLTKYVNSSPLITDVITSQFVKNFMQAINMPPLTDVVLFNMGFCISLLICFVGSFSICEATLSYSNALEAFGLTTTIINRKLGAGFGATRGFVLVLIFIIILQRLFTGDLPASQFVNLLGPSATKMKDIIVSGAPEEYLRILEDRNLYNKDQILNDLTNPR